MSFDQRFGDWVDDHPIITGALCLIIFILYIFALMFIPWLGWHMGTVATMAAIAIDIGLVAGGLFLLSVLDQ